MVGPYDLESDSYFADPYETYARMRRDDPAYFDQARGIWILPPMLGRPRETRDWSRAAPVDVSGSCGWSGDPDEIAAVAYGGGPTSPTCSRDLMGPRRKDPADDLLSALVEADEDGQFLTE